MSRHGPSHKEKWLGCYTVLQDTERCLVTVLASAPCRYLFRLGILHVLAIYIR